MLKDSEETIQQEFRHAIDQCRFIDQIQITNWVEKTLSHYQFYNRYFIPHWILRGFFRARKHNHAFGNLENKTLKKFTSEREFWNRPVYWFTSDGMGRCNTCQESYLYCSNEMHTAILEVKPEVGDFISTALYSLKDISNYTGARFNFIGAEYLKKYPVSRKLFKTYLNPQTNKQL